MCDFAKANDRRLYVSIMFRTHKTDWERGYTNRFKVEYHANENPF